MQTMMNLMNLDSDAEQPMPQAAQHGEQGSLS